MDPLWNLHSASLTRPSLFPNLGPTSLDSPPQLLPPRHSFQPTTRAARPLNPRKRRSFQPPDLPSETHYRPVQTEPAVPFSTRRRPHQPHQPDHGFIDGSPSSIRVRPLHSNSRTDQERSLRGPCGASRIPAPPYNQRPPSTVCSDKERRPKAIFSPRSRSPATGPDATQKHYLKSRRPTSSGSPGLPRSAPNSPQSSPI